MLPIVIEFIALRTSDDPPTELLQRDQTITDDNTDTLQNSLIGFLNKVHELIGEALKIFPNFPKTEKISITYSFEIKDDEHFFEEFKCEAPRYLIHTASKAIRSEWRNEIEKWILTHY